MTEPLNVSRLAKHVGGGVVGHGNVLINQVASLETAGEGDIAYVEDEKFFPAASASKASCLIVPESAQIDHPCLIEVKRPKLAFAQIAAVLHPPKHHESAVHASAVIAEIADVALTAFVGPHVTIGENSSIGVGTQILSGVSIGDNVTIGADCVIHPNTVVYDNVTIGDRVTLHAGMVIGADGFGYVRDEQSHYKFPQIGTVLIEDDVELGANTTVDRAALGLDLVTNPDQAALPENAFRICAAIWKSKGANEAADQGDFRKTTRLLFGGVFSSPYREEFYKRAKEVFGIL